MCPKSKQFSLCRQFYIKLFISKDIVPGVALRSLALRLSFKNVCIISFITYFGNNHGFLENFYGI